MSPELLTQIGTLLDRALADEDRVQRSREGSMAGGLYLNVIRWDLVREARRLLADP